MNSTSMTASFEAQKNTKAFAYTALICAIFLAIAFLYKWPLQLPPIPAMQDLIEINLGNEQEGMGDVQPLVTGDPAPEVPEQQSMEKYAAVNEEPAKDIQANEDDDKEAAPVTKPVKANKEAKTLAKETITKSVKTNNTVPALNPKPTPPKPKIALYKGGNGWGGNSADQDNGYKNQGNKPGNGDKGNPTGNPDSYGKSPGGKPGAPIVRGNRKIVRYYSFTGDLEKATVYATVKVTPEGIGTFAGFAKNSSTTARAYANAIVDYLRNVKFDKADHESTVTVQFNFNIQ